MRKAHIVSGGVVLAVLAALPNPAAAQICGCTAYRVVCKTIYEQQPVTAFRLEYETVLQQRHAFRR